jgi:hypothetical protein
MEDTMPKEASPQRQSRLYAITEHCKAHILMLKEEVNLMVDHPVGVAGHTSYLSDVENKLAEIAEFKGMLDVLQNEFK